MSRGPHLPNIRLEQGHDRLCASACRHELDLEPIRLIELHDGSKVAGTEAVLGEIAREHDAFEKLQVHLTIRSGIG
jgi:hypothetical protein